MNWIDNIRNIFKINRLDSHDSDSKVVAINLNFALKHCGYFAMLPENLDLDAHIEKYPLTAYYNESSHPHPNRYFIECDGKINSNSTVGSKFDIEGLIHILDLLNVIPARHKDLISEDGLVPINAATIRNYFKDYLCYLNYLIDTGVLVTDNHYIPGETSIGYKLAPEYANSKLIMYNYRKYSTQNTLAVPEQRYNSDIRGFVDNQILNYLYLTHWFNQKKLVIDKQRAEDYAFSLMQKKFALGYSSWDINRGKNNNKRKYPRTQYEAIMRNINHIAVYDYNAMIDTNVHRLHSVLTNMQKEFRNFLKYDGQQLVSFDVKNSQPFLSCILFNPDFWSENSSLPLRLNQLPDNIQQSIAETSIKSNLINFFNSLTGNEFEEYKSTVSSGRFYEAIIQRIQEEKGETLTKEDVKPISFKLFFAKNRDNVANHWLMVYFMERFPQVAEVFRIIKMEYEGVNEQKQHGRLACLLQSIESEIILHRCCKRIWEDKNQEIPLFTIHDSIATTFEHKDYVKDLMIEVLTQCIGISPTLSEEIWHPRNLK